MGYADGCPTATQRPCRSSNGCLFLQHSTDVIYDMPAFGGAHINGINRHHRTAEGHHAKDVTIGVVFGIPGMHITARGQIPGFQNQFSPNQPIASTGLTVTRNATTPALRPRPPARCPPETSRFISPRRIQPAHRAPPAARSLFRPSRREFSTTKSSIGPRIIPCCPPGRLSPLGSPDLVGRSVTLGERRAHRPFDSQSTPSMGGNAARRGVDGSTGCLLRGFARSRIPEELTGIPQLYPLAR